MMDGLKLVPTSGLEDVAVTVESVDVSRHLFT